MGGYPSEFTQYDRHRVGYYLWFGLGVWQFQLQRRAVGNQARSNRVDDSGPAHGQHPGLGWRGSDSGWHDPADYVQGYLISKLRIFAEIINPLP